MSREIEKKIFDLEESRRKLIASLLKDREMVSGSFCEIYVKCGKKHCHCNSGPGHPHKRMSLRIDGKSYSRAVPREDHVWIQKMTDNFREYRSMRKQLAGLDAEIQKLLDDHESKIVQRHKQGKKYLNIDSSEATREKASEMAKEVNHGKLS